MGFVRCLIVRGKPVRYGFKIASYVTACSGLVVKERAGIYRTRSAQRGASGHESRGSRAAAHVAARRRDSSGEQHTYIRPARCRIAENGRCCKKVATIRYGLRPTVSLKPHS